MSWGSPPAGTPTVMPEIETDTGLAPLDLPMEHSYRIDLGFSLENLP